MKKGKFNTRILCVALAFFTVLTAAPLFSVEAEATKAHTAEGVLYDFNAGSARSALASHAGVGALASNFTYKDATTMSYYNDPDGSDNIVIGKKPSTSTTTYNNCQFRINDVGKLLLDTQFCIEARFFIKAYTDSTTPLSLIAWNNGSANKPMIRLTSGGVLQTGDCNSSTSYTSTSKTLELDQWYTIKLEVDEVAHEFKLYVDGEYIATQTIGDFTGSGNIRFLYSDGGTYDIYVDDISIKLTFPTASYDFFDATDGDALDSAYLTKKFGLSGGTVTNMVFCTDPIDETNVVVGRGDEKTNGCFYVVDDNGALVDSHFSIEADYYIKDSFPVTDGESGSPHALMAWNDGSNKALVRVKSDGIVQLRNSSGTLADTSASLSCNTWHRLRLDVNEVNHIMALWIDGEFAASTTIGDFTASKSIRILQPNGICEIYVDNLSITKYVVDEADELLDFEHLDAETTLSTSNSTAALFPSNYKATPSGLKAIADPADETNKVSTNTGNAYILKVNDPGIDLWGKDFVTSADFMFKSFPTAEDGSYGTVSFLAWVTNDSSYKVFCGVDTDGNFMSRGGNSAYSNTGIVLKTNQWYNVAAHYNGSSGNFDVYLDGTYVFSETWAAPTSEPTSSYIRVLNNYEVKFEAYVDNVMLYEESYEARTKAVADTIWDIDFESGFAGTKPTMEELNAISSVADLNTSYTTWTSTGTFVTHNGSKALKVAGGTNNQQIDFAIGNADYDPMKNGTVKLSLDFTLEALPTTSANIQFLRWRKYDISGATTVFNIINIKPNDETSASLDFFATDRYLSNKTSYANHTRATGELLELNKTYNIEVIFNNRIVNGIQYCDVTLNLENLTDGTGKKTVVDSYPIWNGTNVMAENYSYFLDDAGNKCYMPYFGLAKSYRIDKDGNKMTDSEGNYLYVDKLVTKTTSSPDTFRMFQGSGSASSGYTYYIDNFKIEKTDDKSIIDSGFENWENYSFTYDMATQKESRYYFGTATMVNENGNTYAQLPNVYTTGGTADQRHFWVGDYYKHFTGKDIYLETDVYLEAESTQTFASSALIAFLTQKAGSTSADNPFGWSSGGTEYGFLLYADSTGKLYPVGSATEGAIGQLKVGGWTNIGVSLQGDGEAWTGYSIYVEGKLVYAGTFSSNKVAIQKTAQTMSFRFTNIKGATVGYDNISITEITPKIEPLTLGFEDESEQIAALSRLGGSWQYGNIGAARTDRDGNVVKSAEILGTEEEKYLRVNHEKLTDSKNAYVDIVKDNFIDEDTYLIETSVRYSSSTAYSLNVAEIYSKEKAQSAPVLSVRGDTNKMFITLRGVQYDLVNSAGKLIYASKPTDESFTDVAILVDDVNSTYTLYVNGRLAYYTYNEKILPCVDMPLHFIDSTADISNDFIRLVEIPNVKFAESIVDIDYINVRATPNGLSVNIKGTQTRSQLYENSFDVRFVSGIDTLYGSAVGYEVTAEYTDTNGAQKKSYDKSSSTVYDKITADGEDITAEDLESQYIVAVEIVGIPLEYTTVTFTAKPYINRGGVKVYGESYTVTFTGGKITE